MSSDDPHTLITFRSYRLEDDDCRKSIAKMEPSQMEKLGIKGGDMIKVVGRESAVAFCFSLNEAELEKTKLHDVKIEYLNPSHKEIEHPRIVLSNVASQNACPSRRKMLVQVEKFAEKDSGTDIIPEASIVTLGTPDFAEKMMPDYKENIDFSPMFGRPIKKRERINLPFSSEYSSRYQQKFSVDRRHPVSFSSIIVDARPENSEFWLVTENTKFQFQSVSMDEFRGKAPRSEAMSLLRVVPIVKRMHLHDTEIVFASLEVFEDSMKLGYYTQQRVKLPEDFLSNPAKANSMTMVHDNPELTVEIKDNLGNVHSDGFSAGGGGSTGPDPSTGELVSDRSNEYRFASTLDPDAKEITITVKDIMWMHRTRFPKPAQPPTMKPLSASDHKMSVLEGPWEFKVTVN